MRCLLSGSVVMLLFGCASAYKNLQPASADVSRLLAFKPAYTVALYKAKIDVLDNYLSGLLLIKRMPDSSLRLVFSNEIGVQFFDFEFSSEGVFKVHSAIKQLDRKAVITTLRKDFELVLMEGINPARVTTQTRDGLIFYSFPQAKGYYRYVTNRAGDTLVRMERSTKRTPVMQAIMQEYTNGVPDSIGITHHRFKFNIGLKILPR